ncbi:MAG: MoaD/ThiS family protein [Candidatus Hodarchaeales archaeon]
MTVGKVKILFQGTFREVTKEREIYVEFKENCTLAFILDLMADRYGLDFKNITDPKTDKISTDILVMLNGRGLRTTDSVIKDNDVLMFTIPLGGG